jgi:uncharacterized protein (DUF885 family)
MRFGPLIALLASACGGSTAPSPEPAPPPAEPTFAALADQYFAADLDAHPGEAVSRGFHEYDGLLPDHSAAGIERRITLLREAIAWLEAIDPETLSPTERIERAAMRAAAGGELFNLADRELWRTNPMFYAGALDLSYYVSREYAPLEKRAAAAARLAARVPKYLETARANLAPQVPRTFVDTALLQVNGQIEFINTDVVEAFAALTDETVKLELAGSLEVMAQALQTHRAYLEELQKNATGDFRLGADAFRKMLREAEGIDIEIDALREIGEADLRRNLELLAKAAGAIDPDRSPMAVAAAVDERRPAPDEVLEVAAEQARHLRRYLIDKSIVSIPSDDVAEVRASPPFMRWNSAFLSGAGAFETKKLPSFYYISPPDPKWPEAEQLAYVPSTGDLFSTTVHELWPGHFLHALHLKANKSRILKTQCTYSMTEGWAHYTEEMMWNQGALGSDPAIHIGQLGDALLRDVRYLSAIGYHAGDLTVAQSEAMFRDKAFQDPGNARQQAVRGTFDPGYLNYTLGKLMIRKLRDDWKAKMRSSYSPRAFHDAFLSHGCAPIPAIRESMLGPGAGPAL